MKKIIFALFVIYCSLQIVNAQVNQEWVVRYNSPANNYDGGNSIAVDGSGNVYVTGYSVGSGTGYDYATIKYNSSGDTLWIAGYNGPGNNIDEANSIAVDGSGNVYVTGSSAGSGTGQDYATIKYNSSGVQQWVARYTGPAINVDKALSLAVDGIGNVYVTGWSQASGTGRDYATIKYNSSGDSLWVQRYNGSGNHFDEANSIAVDGSGSVYVTGSDVGVESRDFATIKYNSAGVRQWVARYNGPGNGQDIGGSLAVDGMGNVYVTGWSQGSGTESDYATLKYNSSGDSLWVARYNGPENRSDVARSLAVDGSGNVYVTGWSYGIGTFQDYATIKYNSSGVRQWVARYNGPGNDDDVASSLSIDGSGNVYVTGRSNGILHDYATLKYNSSGVQLWAARYNGPGNLDDDALDIAVDNSGNVYVTGLSYESWEGIDFATIKYSQLVGITPLSNQIPDAFLLEQNYPNPFNPSTKISFVIPNSGSVKLSIFDLLGREVTTLVNQHLNPGGFEVDWNASNYSSGIYYYSLVSGDFKQTRKMMLIK